MRTRHRFLQNELNLQGITFHKNEDAFLAVNYPEAASKFPSVQMVTSPVLGIVTGSPLRHKHAEVQQFHRNEIIVLSSSRSSRTGRALPVGERLFRTLAQATIRSTRHHRFVRDQIRTFAHA